ncbi:MAG: hypothetical protein ABF868_12205 [Sporolactobacillus sp.]
MQLSVAGEYGGDLPAVEVVNMRRHLRLIVPEQVAEAQRQAALRRTLRQQAQGATARQFK